ncbi:MAG: FAD-binding protein [Armatimonadota bacterium]|nr:FAD-binding protein [Armatimonadota bacterium]
MLNGRLLNELRQIVGDDGVLAEKGERAVYENDAYPLEKAAPLATVLPKTTEQVAAVVRLCAQNAMPFAPRGAGTGLAGGTLCPGGLLIGLARMNKILDIDLRNRRLTAQAGAINIALTKAVAGNGYLYAPDPSSQGASTLGGNIANNAGGPHTLKYGVTANHVLAVTLVLPDGEVVTLGDKTEDVNGYDLLGVALGSEGTFGIVTEAIVRLTRAPQAVRTLLAIFDTPDEATQTVSDIIAAGIVPAALEMMDGVILQTVEDAFHFGFPRDAGAILIIELDGLEAGLETQVDRVRALCETNTAREVRQAHTAKDRANLWAARKKAVGTLGRLAPSCVTQDCVIPRSKLPEVLRAIAAIGAKYHLRIANVFHAGDGNLHPVTLFDERDPDEVKRVMAASHEILELCVGLGGTLTGEHGIGVEKRDYMPLLFPPETLQTMADLRAVFNPAGLCNPDKVLPTAHGCAYEIRPRSGAVAV